MHEIELEAHHKDKTRTLYFLYHLFYDFERQTSDFQQRVRRSRRSTETHSASSPASLRAWSGSTGGACPSMSS